MSIKHSLVFEARGLNLNEDLWVETPAAIHRRGGATSARAHGNLVPKPGCAVENPRGHFQNTDSWALAQTH